MSIAQGRLAGCHGIEGSGWESGRQVEVRLGV